MPHSPMINPIKNGTNKLFLTVIIYAVRTAGERGAPLNPPDPILISTHQFKADSFGDKVNVGIGAYRTDEGKPWVLPTVKRSKRCSYNDPEVDHEYLPIDGLASLLKLPLVSFSAPNLPPF